MAFRLDRALCHTFRPPRQVRRATRKQKGNEGRRLLEVVYTETSQQVLHISVLDTDDSVVEHEPVGRLLSVGEEVPDAPVVDSSLDERLPILLRPCSVLRFEIDDQHRDLEPDLLGRSVAVLSVPDLFPGPADRLNDVVRMVSKSGTGNTSPS